MPIVQWSPHNPRQFATCWEKLSLYEIEYAQRSNVAENTTSRRYSRTAVLKSQKDVNAVSCLDWYPHSSNPSLMAWGGLQGSVVLTSFAAEEGSMLEDLTAQYTRRPCNAIAWNPQVPNQLAAGFEKLRSESCAMVWDVNYLTSFGQQNKEIQSTEHRLALSEHTASLTWLRNDPHTLAVGTGLKWLRLYDIRVSGPAQLSVLAHAKAVKGIAMDPFNEHTLATFSDAPQDLVRVWDMRKMAKSSQTPVVAVNPFVWSASPLTSLSVGQIAWSPQRSGVLAVTLARQSQVMVYSLDRHEQAEVTVPADVKHCSGAVQSISWQHCDVQGYHSSADGVRDTYSHRLLVATSRMTVEDISMHESQPLAVNAHSDIVYGAGRKLYVMPEAVQPEGESEESILFVDAEDQMKRRTALGYSADSGKNLQVLSDELDTYENAPWPLLSPIVSLRRIWTWVERVENIFETGSRSLLDCGIEHMLSEHKAESTDDVHSVLGCTMYHSQGRSLARLVCGWVEQPWGVMAETEDESYSSQTELYRIVSEFEMDSSFERAATLALFHGNLELAVAVLRRSAQPSSVLVDEDGTTTNEDILPVHPLSEHDAQLINLVAMCFAGFQNVRVAMNVDQGRAAGRLWLNMCDTVIAQLSARRSRATAYLIAACKFLQEIVQSAGQSNADVWRYRSIIEEPIIAVEDRIAFACTYLTDSQLSAFLGSQSSICKLHGNIEGLMISGLNHQGVSLLQQYVDKFNDIQTAALIVGRVDLPATMVVERRACDEWLQNYRQLLNRWQLWQDRALLDVELGDIKRAFRPRLQEHNPAKPQTGSLYETPSHNQLPHLSLQCQYCNAPLPADVLLRADASAPRTAGASATSWLQRQRPILTCCPSCRKPLPKCYLCLLACGLINPYMKYVHARKTEELRANASTVEGLHAGGALEFGKWFTWCQKCKHGGHAVCMASWFGKHGQCGVNGCDCYCTGLEHDACSR